jgi:hypothetical protein
MRLVTVLALAGGFAAAPVITAGHGWAWPASSCDGVECVPGVVHNASLGAPCTSGDRFVFGVDATSTYVCSLKGQWVPSKPLIGVRPFGGPCDGNPNAAQSPDGIPMACNGTGWVYNFNDIYYAKTY